MKACKELFVKIRGEPPQVKLVCLHFSNRIPYSPGFWIHVDIIWIELAKASL